MPASPAESLPLGSQRAPSRPAELVGWASLWLSAGGQV